MLTTSLESWTFVTSAENNTMLELESREFLSTAAIHFALSVLPHACSGTSE
jgi:hypothetical protein